MPGVKATFGIGARVRVRARARFRIRIKIRVRVRRRRRRRCRALWLGLRGRGGAWVGKIRLETLEEQLTGSGYRVGISVRVSGLGSRILLDSL